MYKGLSYWSLGHDIAEILLNLALNTNQSINIGLYHHFQLFCLATVYHDYQTWKGKLDQLQLIVRWNPSNPETLATLGTQKKPWQTKHKNTTQRRKLKRWATQTPPNTGVELRCLWMVRQFLLLIRHLPCYSYTMYIVKSSKSIIGTIWSEWYSIAQFLDEFFSRKNPDYICVLLCLNMVYLYKLLQ